MKWQTACAHRRQPGSTTAKATGFAVKPYKEGGHLEAQRVRVAGEGGASPHPAAANAAGAAERRSELHPAGEAGARAVARTRVHRALQGVGAETDGLTLQRQE